MVGGVPLANFARGVEKIGPLRDHSPWPSRLPLSMGNTARVTFNIHATIEKVAFTLDGCCVVIGALASAMKMVCRVKESA